MIVGAGALPLGLADMSWAAQTEADQTKGKLIIHSTRPEDFETVVEALDSWITPNDLFFVRSHMYTPSADGANWKLKIGGAVEKPLELSMDQLKAFGEVTLPALLECTGNGRAFHEPRVAGVQWGHGAVGNARWTGVRLRDVLKKAGVKPQGKYLTLDGADKPITKVMPDFIRSLPVEKAMDEHVLLAYKMNGETLSPSHGYPLRLIVPGWTGAYWVKWLNTITLTDHEDEGFFMKTAYRAPKIPVAPGADVNPQDMEPVKELQVKSIIVRPTPGTKVPRGAVKIMGAAWSSGDAIARVEVSTDMGRTWQRAELGKDQARYAWRFWEYTWKADRPGSYLIMARATDSTGRAQPISPTWNPSGYLWNVIDKVRIHVEAS
jgi:DMSO/TMAO reductase YedYZ molybdopterin-dependent catalytic subunit